MEIGKLEFSIDSTAITKAADEIERLVFAIEELQRVTGRANIDETFEILWENINNALKDGMTLWGNK